MKIFIPTNLSNHEPELKRHVEAMVYKLRKNAHKGKWEGVTIDELFSLMVDEMKELHAAINEGTSIEIALEAADISNFAMMIAAVAIEGRQSANVQS